MTKPAGHGLPTLLLLAIVLAIGFVGPDRLTSAQNDDAGSVSADIEANCALAESLINLDQYDQARKYLERNLKIERHHAHSHFLLGEIHRRKNTIFDRRLSA